MRSAVLALAAALTASLALLLAACPTTTSSSSTPYGYGSGEVTPKPAPPAPTSVAPRTPAVHRGHADYARVEGIGMPNECGVDGDCFTGGCSAEICSAEASAQSTCIAKNWPTKGANCGCVGGACIWYTAHDSAPPPDEPDVTPPPDEPDVTPPPDEPDVTPPPDPPPPTAPAQGQKCGEGDACAPGLTCIKYYGIAGPSGPSFSSCEIRCGGKKKGACPAGQTCGVIADGPGEVCR